MEFLEILGQPDLMELLEQILASGFPPRKSLILTFSHLATQMGVILVSNCSSTVYIPHSYEESINAPVGFKSIIFTCK